MTTLTANKVSTSGVLPLEQALRAARTNTGESLADLSMRHPVLAVFLRHSGCPFCREAIRDVQRRRAEIERDGTRIVFVHQGPEDEFAASLFGAAGLGDVPRIADPGRALYEAMGLRRGNLWQMFGPKIWWRTMQAFATGVKVGKMVGDAFQMPGVFMISKGKVVGEYRHKGQADRPDYAKLACPLSSKQWGKE
jgi:peroxiredoxin